MAFVSAVQAAGANEEIVLGPIYVGAADFVSGSCWAEQGGTLVIEQSGDGTNWDIAETLPAIGVDTVNEGFDVKALLQQVRIRFTNASTPGDVRIFARTTSSGARP